MATLCPDYRHRPGAKASVTQVANFSIVLTFVDQREDWTRKNLGGMAEIQASMFKSCRTLLFIELQQHNGYPLERFGEAGALMRQASGPLILA